MVKLSFEYLNGETDFFGVKSNYDHARDEIVKHSEEYENESGYWRIEQF